MKQTVSLGSCACEEAVFPDESAHTCHTPVNQLARSPCLLSFVLCLACTIGVIAVAACDYVTACDYHRKHGCIALHKPGRFCIVS